MGTQTNTPTPPVSPQVLKAQKKIEELRNLYTEDRSKEFAKIFLYGDWGTFKTTLATTMPRPILFHTFDPGGDKVKHIQDGVADGSIVVERRFQQREKQGAEKIFNNWNKEYDSVKSSGVLGGHFKTFVIDSLTTLQRLVVDAAIDANPKNNNVSSNMPFKVAQMRDYGVQDSAMEFIISDIISQPCHIVILAHSEEGTDEKSDVMYHRPLITGKKLKTKIPLLFDEIYVSTAQGGRGRVFTHPVGIYHARTRLGSRFPIAKQYENKTPGDFNLTRDILVPAGFATPDEIPVL